MRLAELDWGEVLRALPRWEALSPGARRAFLQVRPGVAATPESLGAALDELVASGVMTAPGPKAKLYPHAPELRPLLVALRAMDRSRPLEGPGGRLTDAYLQDQLNLDETATLTPGQEGFRHWVDRAAVAAEVSSVAWVRGFLAAAAAGEAARWEQARTTRADPVRLAVPKVAEALAQLVRALAEHPAGVALRSLPQLLPGVRPEYAHAALAAGLRYLLVFVSTDDGPHALLGLLPCIVRRLGAPPGPPSAVEATAVFEAPFHATDMTVVLVEAAAQPIPLRGSDGSLYVRVQKALAARLLKLPAWAEGVLVPSPYLGEDEDDDGPLGTAAAERIETAAAALQVHRYAAVEHTGERYQLAATAAGRAWLALSEGERLKELLDTLRASSQRNPAGYAASAAGPEFFGVRLPFSMEGAKLDLRAALTTALLSAPAGAMIPLAGFMRYHTEVLNPFTGPEADKLRARSAYSGAPRTMEGWESVWAQILMGFLAYRLVPLGGASLGQTPAGVGFALTDVGRYLLGAADELRLAAPAAGEVLVQPDFEIVFLAAAPRVEAELARFAERTGTGVGALFRITHASVLRAAEQGLTAERMLKALGEVSRMPIPGNVSRQVRDWFASTRRVRIRPTVLVECPDTETAARVTGLGGAQVTPVTRTILRLDGNAKALALLVKKLRAKGIFVQE